MHHPRRLGTLFALAVASVLLASGFPAGAQTPPDNTKVNKRNQAKWAATADQQNENSNDREITRKIRRAVMDDATLSTYAHNVKMIWANRAPRAGLR